MGTFELALLTFSSSIFALYFLDKQMVLHGKAKQITGTIIRLIQTAGGVYITVKTKAPEEKNHTFFLWQSDFKFVISEFSLGDKLEIHYKPNLLGNLFIKNNSITYLRKLIGE